MIGLTNLKKKCLICAGKIPLLYGLVWSNFDCACGVTNKVCNGAWHGNCYVQSIKDVFPVMDLINEEVIEADDKMGFREAHDGDHLMTTFQCNQCHFKNCKGRSTIIGNEQDDLDLLCIRRATLDAFWSR